MLALVPPLPTAWTSEWQILKDGQPVGTARETWRLAADGSGTTRFVQTSPGAEGSPGRSADRQATLGPGGVPRHEEVVVTAPTGRTRYAADLGPKLATLRVTAATGRATYELNAPAGLSRGALTPAAVERLARTGTPVRLAVFETVKARWSVVRVTPGKRMGKDTLIRLVDDAGVQSDYAFDATYRARIVQFSTGYRFVRTTMHEGS